MFFDSDYSLMLLLQPDCAGRLAVEKNKPKVIAILLTRYMPPNNPLTTFPFTTACQLFYF